MNISIEVNGKAQSLEVEGRTLLVEVLREQLGLTGTHVGCDTSQCGCCTVLVDGQGVKACTMLAGRPMAAASPPSRVWAANRFTRYKWPLPSAMRFSAAFAPRA